MIAGAARLEGTIRAQDRDVREALHKAIERIALAVGQLHGARVEVEVRPGTPPLINPPDMAGWNLAVRFVLEIVALVALAAAAWSSVSGPTRGVVAVVVHTVSREKKT